MFNEKTQGWRRLIQSYQYWYLYMLECNDGSIYSGITVDVNERMEMHMAGKGSKYVRSRLPVTLLAWWKFKTCKSEITKLEGRVKSFSKRRKQKLAGDPELLIEYCGKPGENTELLFTSES